MKIAWDYSQAAGRVGAGRVIVEGFIDFEYEITLLTVRAVGASGEVETFFCDPIGHVQVNGDYVESWQPMAMTPAALQKSRDIARAVTGNLGGRGIFGVELFVRADKVWFSEVSPRPHDTGLVTLATQRLSEFELHARAILGLPVDTEPAPPRRLGGDLWRPGRKRHRLRRRRRRAAGARIRPAPVRQAGEFHQAPHGRGGGECRHHGRSAAAGQACGHPGETCQGVSIPAGPPQGDAAKDMEPRQRRTKVTPFPGKGAGGMAELSPAARGFAARLIRWHKRHGRHDLPWQNTSDPYRVWLSEIMLQQTQVATVIPYYRRFLERFPQLADLAAAPVADVMALWSGLGYYARARNLHACAQAVMTQHGGKFPRDPAVIALLPGIGRSTANSIATICFGARAPILDGNVKRVLCRAFGIEGFSGSGAVEKRLWALAAELMPARAGSIYNQAQMDLGATVCTRAAPRCETCPLGDLCVARATGRTAELPTAKPRRTIPQREATLLVLRDDDRVLLETRPPAGIWGGLLSLPELPQGADAREWAERRFACTVIAASPAPARCVPLETFVHAFSHFRLHIAPLLLQVKPRPAAMEPGWQWLDLNATADAALPAPVRRILDGLQTSGSKPLLSRKR